MGKNLNKYKLILKWSNIVNFLTVSRIFLGLPLMLSLTFRRYEYSFLFLVLGALTDYLDGYLARNKNCKTIIGAQLDPIADKILLIGPFIWIAHENLVPVWSIWLLLSRELLITGWRSDNSTGAPASTQGKLKTTFQFTSLILLLWPQSWASENTIYVLNSIGYILFWISLLLALGSAIKYLLHILKPKSWAIVIRSSM